MTSKQNDAFVRWSGALRHTDRLTKYFPSHGPFPMIDAKIFVSFAARSMNSNLIPHIIGS